MLYLWALSSWRPELFCLVCSFSRNPICIAICTTIAYTSRNSNSTSDPGSSFDLWHLMLWIRGSGTFWTRRIHIRNISTESDLFLHKTLYNFCKFIKRGPIRNDLSAPSPGIPSALPSTQEPWLTYTSRWSTSNKDQFSQLRFVDSGSISGIIRPFYIKLCNICKLWSN